MRKIFFYALLAFGIIYASTWIFNHINAWAGIALFVVSLGISAEKIYKHFNKNEEKND